MIYTLIGSAKKEPHQHIKFLVSEIEPFDILKLTFYDDL
jgi:hypothetical protein